MVDHLFEKIRDYLIKVGCRVEYPILVNAFKNFLYDPDPGIQAKIRVQFKDYVNRLATVCVENNMKHIVLRPEFRPAVDESDSSSYQPLDDLRKKWTLESCNCNYNGLIALLREDNRLAGYKDTVGYTALHWAAKSGNLAIIKLIAGVYGISPDILTSSGFTALHLAYLFKKNEAINLLIDVYKADTTIRDFSGRRPDQYN